MSTEIYYFSGTGNSLAVARDLAEKMSGKLISIPSVIGRESITPEADVVGIVFPVYNAGFIGIPRIVQRFVGKLENISAKYIFAICTYGGGFGPTIRLMGELVRARGGRLAAGFGVQMPQNAWDKPLENREKLFDAWKKKKLTPIYKYVNARKTGRFDADGFIEGLAVAVLVSMARSRLFRPLLIGPVYRAAGCPGNFDLPFSEAMPLIDHSFYADGNCTGCGTCSKVCPVHNINMVDGEPAWQHRCENCLACINWCPKKAIHDYLELPNGRRYHHPEVKLSDVMGHGKNPEGC